MTKNLASLLSDKGLRRIDLAKALGVHKSMVTRWSKKRVPAERVAEIEAATGISPYDMRPDLFRKAPDTAA